MKEKGDGISYRNDYEENELRSRRERRKEQTQRQGGETVRPRNQRQQEQGGEIVKPRNKRQEKRG